VWNKATFVIDVEKLIILMQGHERLHNLQHNDNDNSLIKDNCWKEIAGELHAQGKEISGRAQHCRRMAGYWHGSGSDAAGERHGMCELAFNTAGERQCTCKSAVTGYIYELSTYNNQPIPWNRVSFRKMTVDQHVKKYLEA
jgi:hypothetical protein